MADGSRSPSPERGALPDDPAGKAAPLRAPVLEAVAEGLGSRGGGATATPCPAGMARWPELRDQKAAARCGAPLLNPAGEAELLRCPVLEAAAPAMGSRGGDPPSPAATERWLELREREVRGSPTSALPAVESRTVGADRCPSQPLPIGAVVLAIARLGAISRSR